MLNEESYGSYISELQAIFSVQLDRIKALEEKVARLAGDKLAGPERKFTISFHVTEEERPGFAKHGGLNAWKDISGVSLQEVSFRTAFLVRDVSEDIAKQLKERS